MCSRTQKLTVVLASASPRRTELLEQGNIKHVVMPSHCERRKQKMSTSSMKRKMQGIFW